MQKHDPHYTHFIPGQSVCPIIIVVVIIFADDFDICDSVLCRRVDTVFICVDGLVVSFWELHAVDILENSSVDSRGVDSGVEGTVDGFEGTVVSGRSVDVGT